MPKILVTGGCGYIGGHTIVDLAEHGFDVISVDDLSNGYLQMNAGVSEILKRPVKNYQVNLCNLEDTRAIFEEHPDISGVIHFAAFKSVPESVSKPLEYFRNNLGSLINVLSCCKEYQVKQFVFSSSCSVYGNADHLPVTESTPMKEAESPYARTKQIGEQICRDFANANPEIKIALLRYFNPVGAHPSALIGELNEKPENLVPVVTQTAIGKRESMTVFGNDYDTRDGSCIRDYIHVMDIANAHTRAIQKMEEGVLPTGCTVLNLGTGNGVSVTELIQAFEKVSGVQLNYIIGPRRAGDVIAVYADNSKAVNMLGWKPKYDIDSMMKTAWDWELSLKKKEESARLN